MKKQRPLNLRRATAYYRLARKAEIHGEYRQADHYRDIADRLVAEERRHREWLAQHEH